MKWSRQVAREINIYFRRKDSYYIRYVFLNKQSLDYNFNRNIIYDEKYDKTADFPGRSDVFIYKKIITIIIIESQFS